jgi:hypothetical protein
MTPKLFTPWRVRNGRVLTGVHSVQYEARNLDEALRIIASRQSSEASAKTRRESWKHATPERRRKAIFVCANARAHYTAKRKGISLAPIKGASDKP